MRISGATAVGILLGLRLNPADAFVPVALRSKQIQTLGSSQSRKKEITARIASGIASASAKNRLSSLATLRVKKRSGSEAENGSESKLLIYLETVQAFMREKLPARVLVLVQKVMDKVLAARVAVFSFIAGMILTGLLIFVPVYQQVDKMSEPVTLFGTILTDLDKGYVESVDTNKLFETGVNAMLRSLDPYTEFEGKKEAEALNESIGGKYGGVGLVISGATSKDIALINKEQARVEPTSASGGILSPKDDTMQLKDGETFNSGNAEEEDLNSEGETVQKKDMQKLMQRYKDQGIRVVSSFEGYAYDYGMRVGDKIVAVNGEPVTEKTSVEDVRNSLRGTPGTSVNISFERTGSKGVQTVTIPRTIVRIRDVKAATLLGKKSDGIGYIQVTGFASETGREVRNAITYLQRMAEDSTNGERSLQGLIIDLRGNPGGLLTSAVDVSSLLVPKGSEIVSAKGRGFPGVTYKSRVEPILDEKTRLAVLVNGGTASAAEIVSGAVQDLDVGVIVGSDRTFGKGLVQNVEELPYDTALKFTVAKYYTPSGRCIQGINYEEGGGLKAKDGKYKAKRIADKDKTVFYTKQGREVKDGGGIEADLKIQAPKASALEVTLLRSGVVADYAAEWSKSHQLSDNFNVDEETYRDFQNFVSQKQKDGELRLDALYTPPLNDLRNSLTKSGYKGSTKELDSLQSSIIREVKRDFEKYRADIKEDVAQAILARYLPESMLIERSAETDQQVQAAVKLVRNSRQFETLLAKGSTNGKNANGASTMLGGMLEAASSESQERARLQIKF